MERPKIDGKEAGMAGQFLLLYPTEDLLSTGANRLTWLTSLLATTFLKKRIPLPPKQRVRVAFILNNNPFFVDNKFVYKFASNQ